MDPSFPTRDLSKVFIKRGSADAELFNRRNDLRNPFTSYFFPKNFK